MISSPKKIHVNEDIYLQPIKVLDAQGVFNIIDSQREYLGEWLPFVEQTKEVIDTEVFISTAIERAKKNIEFTYIIMYKEQLVGLLGLRQISESSKKSEIGYWISQQHQKKGIVTRAVHSICEYALGNLGYNRIQIKCAVGNLPSKKIPKRLGFSFEGIEREGELISENVYTDLEVYSLLKKEGLKSLPKSP